MYRQPKSGLFGESPYKPFAAALSIFNPEAVPSRRPTDLKDDTPILLARDAKEALEAARRAPWLQYSLVVTDPGDTTALVKAAAISLQRKAPPAFAGKKADRAHGAKGRLLKVQGEGENTYLQFIDFINPTLFDV